MREILFRAKRKDNGEWVEGDLFYGIESENFYIRNWLGDHYRCVVGTICQYTGLADKNGKRIWENDIVELPNEDGYFACEWDDDTARYVMNGEGLTVDFDNYWSNQVEVIGNIFDNSELLEK